MKSINIIISGAVIVLLLLGAYFLIQGQSNSANSYADRISPEITDSRSTQSPLISEMPSLGVSPSNVSVTVEYTDNGFSPQTITVKAGAQVTWINKSSNPVWVASNPHPVHTDLPGFDALKGIPPGETYSYTFTKSGKWGYHNHRKASDTGTVIVE